MSLNKRVVQVEAIVILAMFLINLLFGNIALAVGCVILTCLVYNLNNNVLEDILKADKDETNAIKIITTIICLSCMFMCYV